MSDKQSDDQYSEQEAERRFVAAVKAALNTPPKPRSKMKLGKAKGKRRKSHTQKRTAQARHASD